VIAKATNGETAVVLLRTWSRKSLYDEAAQGHAALVAIAGEPGIGKTALCRQLAAYASSRALRHAEHEPSLELLGLIGQVLVDPDRRQEHRERTALLELLELWRMTGCAPDSAERFLESYAYVDASRGDFEDVVRVCSTLGRDVKPFGILTRFGRDIREQLAQARAALGEPAASAAWAEGQAFSPSEACNLVGRRCRSARRGPIIRVPS